MKIRSFVAVTFLLSPLLTSAATVDTYAELMGKTVLAPSRLPLLPAAIDSELPSNKTNAITLLEKGFSSKGISVVQDGPCFVRFIPTAGLQAELGAVPLRGAELHAMSGQQLIAPGMVNFPATDLNQVLNVYAELKGRTILRTRFLPSPAIRFKNQCPLTREELVYGLETVLALNGLMTVDDGQAFVQIVPIQLQSQVNTRAPAAEPGSRQFDRKKVPSIGYSGPPQPQTQLERDLERWQKAFFEFMRLNTARNASAQRLLGLYAGLTDKTAEASKNYETMPIWFHVSTPLTKAQLLYAIETTFALNNLTITSVEENKVRLGPSMSPGKSAAR